MSRLTTELTFDHINDFFKLGVKNPRMPDTLAKSSTGGWGRCQPREVSEAADAAQVPSYRRNPQDAYHQQEYVQQYQKQWEEERLQDHGGGAAGGDIGARSIHTSLSDLESMTESDVFSLPNDIPAELASRVYHNYNFDHTYNPALPITEFSEQVVNTIEAHSVAIIQGPTGSGKTTQVPQYILDYYAIQDKHCNIIVTQPRRIAAISIARRVCEERRWQLGSLVGYQVGMDRCVSDDTRLTFVTTGVLLQRLVNSRTMNKYTHIILDEVHERDQEMDFALLVTRKLQRSNSRHVKIILMSATFDTSMFAHYFAMPIAGKLEDAPVVNIEGRIYDVQEHYVEDISHLGPYIESENGDAAVTSEAYDLARALIVQFDELEVAEQGDHEKSGRAKHRGTVLVFLPGLAEINQLDQLLASVGPTHRLWVLPLHSTITTQEQARAFVKAQDGFRKVILATNIAESSITVPDIKYVIDFMLTKCMVCDPETNYQSLKLHWASKANAIQRKGRAGRVSSGKVYRLVTREFYEDCIQDYGIPEMRRCPLERLILQVKMLDLGEPRAILALALEPPNLDNITRTVLLLKEVGALSTTTGGVISPSDSDGDLTFVGRVLANLPVDIRIGKVLLLGHVFDCLKECLIIGASLSLKSFFARPYKDPLKAYGAKLDWANNSFSDCIAILNAFTQWDNLRQTKGFLRAGMNERKWGEKHMIQINRIREVMDVIKELSDRLAKFNIQLPRGKHKKPSQSDHGEDRLILKIVLAGAFYPNYFSCEQPDEAQALKQLSGKDPCTTVMVSNLPPHSYLYKAEIASLFEQCGKGKQLYFEESKAFIEFERPHTMTTTESSSILNAVYMAVKMRLLRLPMTIQMYEVDEADVKVVEEAKELASQSSRQLRTNRLSASVDTSAPRQVPLPPAKKNWIDVFVTEVVDGNRFWAHYADQETFKQLDNIMRQTNGPSIEKIPLDELPKAGVYCLAPFVDEENDRKYYRARIEAVQTNGPKVRVFYLDYGNLGEVDRQELRKMAKSLLEIPFQAFECVLCEIKPFYHLPNNQWLPVATQRLAELACNRIMTAKVFSVVSGTLRVDLYDCSKEPSLHINQILVREEVADRAEEPYVSKLNNLQRQEEADYKFADSGWVEVPRATQLGTREQRARPRGKASLRGPNSPYEISFGSMTRVGRLRSTKVERDSVNSVALSNAPEEKYEKMMVAAHVGLNHAGNTLLARDTTLMPNIPDLPALICILFAPVMELRRDKKNTRLTGALCGLGYDPETKGAVLPDHDIEVTFDTLITSKDIATINAIRLAMNLAIGSQNAIASWGSSASNQLQTQARNVLLKLVKKKREPAEPVHFGRAYLWQQVDPSEILYTEDEVDTPGYPKLYEFHNSVSLQNPRYDPEEDLRDLREQKGHLDHLHSLANRSTVLFDKPAHCWLCETVFYSPRDLLFHLNTQTHMDEEHKLIQEYETCCR
ncbi:putative ATP-dependent RNA helicase TDRD9 [Acanthaster planci]|uniref:RNA helicase n=1 Tax=Acanthaster planci TaxID=133434 RepID=A0A8B7ZN12_ACAPL|nr:putative ATP-dependent RNA helicase TDRD9 [Acanthaster planci]